MKHAFMPISLTCSLLQFVLLVPNPVLAQWSTDPAENTRVTNGGLLPQIISDGSGGAYIVYQDSPALLRQLWVQWLDRYGYVRFADNGIRVGKADLYQTPTSLLVSDSSGGVIVAFVGIENENGETKATNIYVQRIDSTGTKLWGDAGVSVGQDGSPVSVCSDGAHGVFVFFAEDADSNRVFALRAQRITADGARQWQEDGIVVTDRFILNIPNESAAVSDGAGNAVVLYSDSSMAESDIRLQKLNADGAFLWGDGVDIFSVGRQMAGDGQGGAITAGVRREFDGVSVKYIVGAQRVGSSGQVLWGEKRTAVDSLEDRTSPEIMLSENSQIAFVWQQNISDTLDVFLNKINATGDVIFRDAIEISKFNSRKVAPNVVPSANNSEFVIWYDYRNSSGGLFSPDALYAQRIDEKGNRLWSESDIGVSVSEVQHHSLQLISDLAGGAIACWYEIGAGSGWGIFAQQVSRNGRLGEVLPTSVPQSEGPSLPTHYVLRQSYPNPFNPYTTIKYHIPEFAQVTVKIFDIIGKEVKTLVDEKLSPGEYQVIWNGKDRKGGEVASGIYIYQLRAGSFVQIKKALLIK